MAQVVMSKVVAALPGTLAAFAFAAFHPPFIDTLVGAISDQNYALMLGFALGMFPTAVGGWLQDIIIHRRGGSK